MSGWLIKNLLDDDPSFGAPFAAPFGRGFKSSTSNQAPFSGLHDHCMYRALLFRMMKST